MAYKIVDFGLHAVSFLDSQRKQHGRMGYPRHHLVPPGAPGLYHCFSRCVRRAFLCGQDPLSGRSFEHRKGWIEDRLLLLGECFSVSIHAYAVMSNHLHVVVQLVPQAAERWSAEEVACRWHRVVGNGPPDDEVLAIKVAAEVADGTRIDILRQRLSSLSWFMARLNEPIARRANREDECTGRFWEGRFESVALLDEAAVLTAMVYVDLNPVAAGACRDPAKAAHTSIRHRLRHRSLGARLHPVAGPDLLPHPDMTLASYLSLLRWTAELRARHDGLPRPPSDVLKTSGLRPGSWCRQVNGFRRHYRRAMGSAQAMQDRAAKLGQSWLSGIGFARSLAKG